MTGIVASNALLHERADRLADLLNSGHSLHLFQNNITLKPSTVVGNFIEAGFPGYLPTNLNNKFGLGVKLVDGAYSSTCTPQIFTCTADYEVPCLGWYIQDQFTLKFSHRFPFPLIMTTGRILTLRLQIEVWGLCSVASASP